MVKLMSAIGIPEDRMVHAIINPTSNKGISPITLRKHFREELNQGLVQADIKAGANLLKLTESSAAAAIFWAKCRLRWRERVQFEMPPEPVPGLQAGTAVTDGTDKNTAYEIARRIAFTLYLGATSPAANEKNEPQT